MPVRIKTEHPSLQDNPITQVNVAYTTGTTLDVSNSSDFSGNDYILLETYGNVSCEIGQVASTGAGVLTLVGTLNFPHGVGSYVTKIDYNQFYIMRSITGVGGVFAKFGSNKTFFVDQPEYSVVIDSTGLTTYAYYSVYTNTTTGAVTAQGTTLLGSGLPLYSLGSIQNRTLKLFVDKTGEFITEESIAEWIGEFTGRLNRAITGNETGSFMDFITFTPGTNESTDISTYNAEAILMLEYSTDGGLTFPNSQVISPADSRQKTYNPTSDYTYKIIGDKLFVYDNFPTANVVRMWFFTQQPMMVYQSDNLPVVYRSYSDVYIDYCMMRANEQSRRLQESAAYYYRKLYVGNKENPATFTAIVDEVSNRIDQGNKTIANTYLQSLL